MKKIITSALALMLIVGAAQAQDNRQDKKFDRKEQRGEMKELNLTAEQKTQLKALHEAEKKEMETLKSASLTQEERQTKRKAIHDKYREQMSTILTPEQRTKFETMRKDHEGKGEFRGKGKDKSAKFDNKLNLTEDQKAKMAAIRAEYKPKMEAIRNNSSLSHEQKKEQFQTLAKAQQEQIKSVLTADQLKQMKESRKDRRGKETK